MIEKYTPINEKEISGKIRTYEEGLQFLLCYFICLFIRFLFTITYEIKFHILHFLFCFLFQVMVKEV